MINELAKKVVEINAANGFYEDPCNIATRLMLIVTEVAEACEADRKSDVTRVSVKALLEQKEDEIFKYQFETFVKNRFEDELADIVIRVLDLAGYEGIDLEAHIKAKMRYNSLREYKHGKNY